jgi:hypothetical protein
MRLNCGNACHRPVQNRFSSRRMAKNVKTKICTSMVLPEVLLGSVTQ